MTVTETESLTCFVPSIFGAPMTHTHVKHFVLNTGNVRRCNHLGNGSDHSTRTELLTTINCTLQGWKKYTPGSLDDNQILGHPKLQETIASSERARRQIIVKLFLLDTSRSSHIADAIEAVRSSLAVEDLDVVLLAVPGLADGARTDLHPTLLHLWQELEVQRAGGAVRSVGVCDVTAAQLRALIEQSKSVPSEVQVAFFDDATCCDVIRDVRAVAKEHGIRIGTHSDTADVLPAADFSAAIGAYVAGTWRPLWVARYTVLDPPRSVITNLGYLVAGERE